jgi:hypothetical protein|tara:strand:- start:176 stop:376 length:201 start_codon:yes stop_codon:yes gene_type:complete
MSGIEMGFKREELSSFVAHVETSRLVDEAHGGPQGWWVPQIHEVRLTSKTLSNGRHDGIFFVGSEG